MTSILMLLAIPFFIVGMAVELAVALLRRQQVYRLHDAITNLSIGIGNQAFGLFFKVFLLGVYDWAFTHWGLLHLPASPWMFIPVLVAYDFVYYWAHRWSHEVNLWWGAHVVHHSSEDFNLSVALRQSWFNTVLAFFLFLPLAVAGVPTTLFFLVAAVHTLYQFWIHTESIPKLWRPIEWVFNTPSHHRVHHGRDPKYIDKNHGGVLIIWDRIFGTFQQEEEHPTYGITTPLRSWNPAWANFHYYVDMVRQMRTLPRWRQRLWLILARPGWRPAEMGGTLPIPPVQPHTPKYSTQLGLRMNLYVITQFLLILGALAAFTLHFEGMGWAFRILFLSGMVLSLTIVGALIERRPWIIVAEYVRLVLVLAALNAYYYLNATQWFTIFFVASSIVFALLVFWFTRMVLLREAADQDKRGVMS